MYNILLIEPNNNYYDETALEKPLGGSETAFLFLQRGLKELGHNVDTIFSNSPQPKNSYDLVITNRSPEPLFHINGRTNAVFFQDLPNTGVLNATKQLLHLGKLNKLIFLSQYQKQQYLQYLPEVTEGRNCVMFENSIDDSLFSNIPKENAFIYASGANRGLDILLKMWPDIYAHLPNYTLKIAGSTKMYNVDSNSDSINKEREGLLSVGNDLYNQDIAGVEWLGGLSHAELIKEFEKSKALLYPSTFIETCCHVLNCALHAGASPVVSQTGALAEKVCNGENGIVISGDPHSKPFQAEYINAVIDSVKSGRLDRMNGINRHNYLGWEYKRNTKRLLSNLLESEKYEGSNYKILGVCCSLNGNNKKNFKNLRWYAPYDMQSEEIVGLPIDQARNAAGSMAIAKGADYLLLLDDDIYTESTFLTQMMERVLKYKADVVIANYLYKDKTQEASVTRFVEVETNRAVDGTQLTEAEANSDKYKFITSGLGACLISITALEKIGRPYFRTQNIMPKHLGEDSYFFHECQLLDIPVYAALDIPVIHADSTGIYGKEEHKNKIIPNLIS